MPERAELIASAARLAVEARRAEDDLEAARLRFYSALSKAHAAGATYAELGRAVGLTRSRVAQITKLMETEIMFGGVSASTLEEDDEPASESARPARPRP